MPNLPEPPSLNLSNPSIGSAEGYAGSAAHAYAAGQQFATALREAAAQQERLAQQQKFEQAKADQQKANEYATETGKLREMGGTLVPQYDPANVNGTPGNDGRPTLRRDQSSVQLDQAQQIDDPGHVQIDSQGHAWHIPDLAEREKAKKQETPLDDTNSFIPSGKLAEALQAAGFKAGQRVPMAHLLDTMRSIGLASPEEEQDISSNFQDANGNPTTVAIGRKTGTAKTVKLPEGVSPKTKPESSTPHFAPDGVLGPNGLPLIQNDDGTFSEIKAPTGSKRQLTPGQEQAAAYRDEARADRNQRHADAEGDRNRANAEKMQQRHDSAYEEEHKQWDLSQAYADAAASKEPSVIDPKSGQEVQLTDARKKAYAALSQSAKTKAMQKQKESKQIRKQMGWGEFAGGDQESGSGSTSTSSAPPAQSAPAATPKAQQQTPAKAPPAQGAGTNQPPQQTPKQTAQARPQVPKGYMKVQLKDGRSGWVDPREFDPARMTRVQF